MGPICLKKSIPNFPQKSIPKKTDIPTDAPFLDFSDNRPKLTPLESPSKKFETKIENISVFFCSQSGSGGN